MVATPATPSLVSTFVTSGSVNDISLGSSNTLAFLATGASTKEIQVVSLATLAAPTLFGSTDLVSAANGIAYEATLDRAFVAGTDNAKELLVLQPN